MTDEIQINTKSPLTDQKTLPHRKRGKLNIFIGMAPGVGKTYAMLQSAQKEKLLGRDVVIACVETHGARATTDLTRGLPRIPFRSIAGGGSADAEMDIETILSRRPDLVVVDELAHDNVSGSRHRRRYQDVFELLEAGIDVHTTLDVHAVASCAHIVRQITGIEMGETVPDSVLDEAELELVDLSPAKFSKRLRDGILHVKQNFRLMEANYFSEGNLTALRELLVRLAADRIARAAQNARRTAQRTHPLKSGPPLLAVITANLDSEQVLRWTSNLAKSLNAPWIALHIETPRSSAAAGSARIARDLALAGDLGAEVITTMGDDFVDLLLQIASQRNVTQIIIGDSPLSHRGIFQYDPAFDRLLSEAEDANMHVVRVRQGMTAKPLRLLEVFRESAWPQYLVAAGLVSVITLVAWWLGPRIGGPHAAALIFLLAVVVLGSFVGRGPTLVAATMSALLWDYFILSPVYAFRITHLEDALLLGMYFVVALLMGQLTTRIRSQEAAERLRKERASALYLLTRELTEAGNLDQIVQVAMRQIGQIFNAETAVLLTNLTEASLSPHPASAFKLSGDDERAADWAIKHGRRAGKFSEKLPLADAMYVPLAGSEGIVGVIGVRFSQKIPPTIHQLKLLDAFSQQIAFALDRQRVREISEKARMLAESERLGKTLLNSMSHEIRTPIAVLKSAASNLAQIKQTDSPDNRLAISAAIQDATDRLDRLVGNVLDITRLESGHVKPRFNECDVSDLIHLAISETEQDLFRHKVKVEIATGLPIVRMDFVLMQQALSNLLSNAAFHTPPGTEVLVTARVEKEFLLLEVADSGPGILPESLERIFEKFYRGQNAPTGGTGLGLSLVKGFVDAQGGRVQARNRVGGGALFTIFLPLVNNPTLMAQADL